MMMPLTRYVIHYDVLQNKSDAESDEIVLKNKMFDLKDVRVVLYQVLYGTASSIILPISLE